MSLVELLIAIAVIAVGLSGVAATLYYGHAQSKHGDEIATATQYSRMIIEIGMGRSYFTGRTPQVDGIPGNSTGINDTDGEAPRDLGADPFVPKDFLGYWSTVEADNDESKREINKYKRKIQIERLGAAGTPEERLGRVTVTIYWEPKSEGGKNSVSTSAIIPINPISTP